MTALNPTLPWANGAAFAADIESLLNQMTLAEQVALLAGRDAWTTEPVPRLNVPAIRVTDGPNGARGGGSLLHGTAAACFPADIALGATWNPELVSQIGAALAAETKTKAAQVLLGPTVNIHRSVQNGRNFECFSEDPWLTAELAAAYITGLQSQGIGATIKHFLGNESEYQRYTMSSDIDERTLREVYLLPFEMAVRKAKVWAIMSSYNRVNDIPASEYAFSLTQVLRDEWGFDGVVMSDWFGSHSTAPTVNAGLDLEMPGPTRDRGAKLIAAVVAGEVSPATIRERAHHMLTLIARVFDTIPMPGTAETAVDAPATRALIRKAGAEAAVLVTNKGALPLNAKVIKRLAVLGPNAAVARIMGGGSAQLRAHYAISPLQGITDALPAGVEVVSAPGAANNRLTPLMASSFTTVFYAGRDLQGPVIKSGEVPMSEGMWLDFAQDGLPTDGFSLRMSGSFTPDETAEYQFGLFSAGQSRLLVDDALVVEQWESWQPGENYFGHGSEEKIGTLHLQAGKTVRVVIEAASPNRGNLNFFAVRAGAWRALTDTDFDKAVALAADADVAILCVGLNGDWDTEGRDKPDIDMPGRQNELVEKVCAINPNTIVVLQTGSPVLLPWLNTPAAVLQAWYPGQECGNAIADVLFGKAEPGGRMTQTWPQKLEDHPAYGNYPGEDGHVSYAEGVFLGYRHYESRTLKPLIPFGYGLSYTSFTASQIRLSNTEIASGGQITAEIDVTNRGDRAGQQVIQFYVSDNASATPRPAKELKGFHKLHLQPGETATARVTLTMRDFAYYDVTSACWKAEQGTFTIHAAQSAEQILSSAQLRLTQEWSVAP